MARFVVHKPARLNRLCRLHGLRYGALFGAELTSGLIAMEQGFRDARMTQHFKPEMPGNALRTITSDHNSLFGVEDTNTDRKHFQNAASDVGMVEG